MQKWEYMTIVAKSGSYTSQGYVGEVNGKYIGTAKKQDTYEGCPILSDFLNKIGREGWEVISSNDNYTSQYGLASFILIAKRPIE